MWRRLREERVQELCEQLVPDQRDVLLLRLLAELTVDQMAEALGKTASAVKQLQRGAFRPCDRCCNCRAYPVSGRCGSQGEMPNPEFLEDEVIEAILSGRRPAPAACPNADEAEPESLVAFRRNVRTVADRSVPRPSASLAAVPSRASPRKKAIRW